MANSIDFSVSDVPLNAYEQSAMGLVQWPLFFSGISPVVNLPGVNVGELRLDGEVLAAIFLGRITVWNAPALQALNPGLALPPMPIVVIHRDDSSGTTFALTRYLTQVSSAWAHALGIGSRLIWPVGSGAQGGDGVARVVAKTPGSISYLEFSNAEKHGLAMPKLHTVGGIFVSPSLEMFQATLNTAIWQRPGFYQPFLTSDSPQAWPLVTTSYVLVPRHPEESVSAHQTLAFLYWATKQKSLVQAQHLMPIQNSELMEKIQALIQSLDGLLKKEAKK